MRILVLAGGLSPEREVSLTSGSLIANALASEGHDVLLLDVYLGAESIPTKESFKRDVHYTHSVSEREPDLCLLKAESDNGEALIGKYVIEACRLADVVFLALHGASGENGQIQATLDAFGIRYTGSGYVGSLLAMDKDLSKKLLSAAGVPTPCGLTVEAGLEDAEMIERTVGYPMVVKPCSCGSSVGISMVNDRSELLAALHHAFKYENRILVEKRIVGREFTMGVIDGSYLPPVEIITKEGFYDYKNKYQAGCTEEVCPAELPTEEVGKMGGLALKAFEAIRLRDYARFDFIRDHSGNFWCLEANTLPGMTPTSLLPQEAAAIGMSYGKLCVTLAELALRHGGEANV